MKLLYIYLPPINTQGTLFVLLIAALVIGGIGYNHGWWHAIGAFIKKSFGL